MKGRIAWVVLAVAAASCGGGTEPAPVAVLANSPGTVTTGSPQRLLIGLLSPEAESLAAADRPAEIDIWVGDPDNIVGTAPADYLDTVPGVRGLYRINASFAEAGSYGLTVRAADLPPSAPSPFTVTDDAVVPVPGEPAPRSETATSPDAALSAISSDPEPDPSFYDLTVAEAVSNGTPAVIVFSTPAWCQTATCGPTLDIVKEIAAGRQDVDFVHVEVYENLDAERFEDLVTVPAVTEWGLPSEPWVFVVDATGVIEAAFEGAVEPAELEAAIP